MARQYEMANLEKRLLSVCLSLLIAAPAPSGYAGTVNLPSIGDSSGSIVTPEQERRLGEAFMRSVRQRMKVIDDPEINEYLRFVGYQLVASSTDVSRNFTFFIVQEPSINAFAAPGGFIGMHSGLLLATESESELAAVLAHEIAHITQRHMARAYEAAERMSVPMAAALLAAILLGSRDGHLGSAALAAATAGSTQYQINFTRANEKEADRIGIEMLAQAGFDPRSMPIFFERLQQSSRYYGNTLPEFLSTHPITINRIAESTSRADQYPRRQFPDSLNYHLARARLLVLTEEDPHKAVAVFQERLKNGQYRNEDAERYGYALALLAAGKHIEAREQIQKLRKKDPDRIAYRIAAAEAELAAGNTATSRKLYSESLELYPDNYSLTLHYAETLLRTGDARKAKDILQGLTRNREPTSEVYRLLARAASEAGSPAESHHSMAEYYYLNGQINAAIDQLNIALRKAGNFYQASRIEARLQQLKEEASPELKANTRQ